MLNLYVLLKKYYYFSLFVIIIYLFIFSFTTFCICEMFSCRGVFFEFLPKDAVKRLLLTLHKIQRFNIYISDKHQNQRKADVSGFLNMILCVCRHLCAKLQQLRPFQQPASWYFGSVITKKYWKKYTYKHLLTYCTEVVVVLVEVETSISIFCYFIHYTPLEGNIVFFTLRLFHIINYTKYNQQIRFY